MSAAYFEPLSRGSDPLTATFLATYWTAGPWSADLQHGGPPNALAVALAERALHAESGRTDFVAMRLAADFVGAVPVGPVETKARVVRVARTAALVEVGISGRGRECLLARVWFVRDTDTRQLVVAAPEPVQVARDGAGLSADFGYGASLEWRFIRGAFDRPGPAAAWARPRTALFADDGYELSGLSRAVLVADSGSGISAELDWTKWSFVNVDLDVHLARPTQGEWVLLDSATQLGPAGSALARSTLSDVAGIAGAGLQTLVIAPVTP